MAHGARRANGPVAQSTSTSKSKFTTTPAVDLSESERDNNIKEIPVVKEEETNDTEVLFGVLFVCKLFTLYTHTPKTLIYIQVTIVCYLPVLGKATSLVIGSALKLMFVEPFSTNTTQPRTKENKEQNPQQSTAEKRSLV